MDNNQQNMYNQQYSNNSYAQQQMNQDNTYNQQGVYDQQGAYTQQGAYNQYTMYSQQELYNSNDPNAMQNTAAYGSDDMGYGYGYGYEYEYGEGEIVCPGKEIVCLIFGIGTLLSGICALLLYCVPYEYFINGAWGIAQGIVAITLYRKTMSIATYTTQKVVVGKNLAVVGMICSGAAIAIYATLIILVLVFGWGGSFSHLFQ